MEQLTKAALDQSNPSKDQQPLEDSNKLDTIRCDCGKEWTRESKWGVGAKYHGECRVCSEIRRTEKFTKICPPLYLGTEVERLPQAQLAEAMKWEYGPRGIIFLGETGKGKTRTAWMLLRRILVKDRPEQYFKWFDCIGFGHEIAVHYKKENAEQWLEDVAATPILFLDDLGKLKLTERAEVELFGLIERRCAAQLPIIVTTNDTGDSLASRMTDNRGPAMIRRLREFCQPIQF